MGGQSASEPRTVRLVVSGHDERLAIALLPFGGQMPACPCMHTHLLT